VAAARTRIPGLRRRARRQPAQQPAHDGARTGGHQPGAIR